MKHQELKNYVVTHNVLKMTMKDLSNLARKLRDAVSFDFGSITKYRASLPADDEYSKDSLIEKINVAISILIKPDEEEEEPEGLPEGMVGSLNEPFEGDLVCLSVIGKQRDGRYPAVFLDGKKKLTGHLFSEDFVAKVRKQVSNFRLPVLEVRGLQLHVTGRYHEHVYREYVDDYDKDFVIWFKQAGIPAGELPVYDDEGKLIMDPTIVEVEALHLKPIYKEHPPVEEGQRPTKELIEIEQLGGVAEVSVNYPQYEYIKAKKILPVVMDCDDYDDCQTMWHFIQNQGYQIVDAYGNPKDRKFIFGEPKDLKFFAATKEVWEELFNQPLYKADGSWFDKNPNKTWKAVTGTPREMVGLGATRKKFRLRLVDEEYFRPESLKNILKLYGFEGEALEKEWAKVLGYKKYDGVVHTNGVKCRVLTKRNFRPPTKAKSRAKWKGPKWQFVRSIVQLRTKQGSPAALKGTMSSDQELFEFRCKNHGFRLEDQDGIATMDIIKTNKWKYSHGDIIEFDVEDLEVIKFRMSSWSSTIGTQAIRLHTPSVRELLIENEAPELANLLALSSQGRMDNLFELMRHGGKETSWEDQKTFAARLLLGSRYVPEWGDYRVALYSGPRNTLNARLRTFMLENVLKISLWEHAYYLQTDERLDQQEEYVHQKKLRAAHDEYVAGGGKLDYDRWSVHPDGGGKIPFEYICRPPNVREVRTLMKDETYKWNLGGNPLVGPGNQMGFTVQFSNFNPTYDCWYLSHRAAKTMYRDVDGDMVIVGPSKTVKFPTYVAEPVKVDEDGGEKPVVVNDEDFLKKVLIPITDQAFNNSTAVGRLDNLTRRIIMERWWAWDRFQNDLDKGRYRAFTANMDDAQIDAFIERHKPLTPTQLLEMGQIVENYISGLKHAGKFLALDEMEDYLKETYGVLDSRTGKRTIGKIAQAPNDYLILRPDVGLRSADKSSPSAQLVALSHRVKHTQFHELNPFDVVFNELKDMSTEVHHEDSVWIQEGFKKEWAGILERSRQHAYPWKISEVTQLGMAFGKGYREESSALNKQDLPARERRNAWTALHNKYKGYIESALMQRFGSTKSDAALAFSRQLSCHIGSLWFGINREGNRSLSGSCFWCFDLVDVVLFWVQRWDQPIGTPGGRRPVDHKPNPYLDKVLEAAKKHEEPEEYGDENYSEE